MSPLILPFGLEERGGHICFDHHHSFLKNPTHRILQYRGCGYQTKTIIRLVRESHPEISERKIYSTIQNFERKTGMKFRERVNIGRRREHYAEYAANHVGESFNEAEDYTDNRPLTTGETRRFKGITKAEKKLLKEIRA